MIWRIRFDLKCTWQKEDCYPKIHGFVGFNFLLFLQQNFTHNLLQTAVWIYSLKPILIHDWFDWLILEYSIYIIFGFYLNSNICCNVIRDSVLFFSKELWSLIVRAHVISIRRHSNINYKWLNYLMFDTKNLDNYQYIKLTNETDLIKNDFVSTFQKVIEKFQFLKFYFKILFRLSTQWENIKYHWIKTLIHCKPTLSEKIINVSFDISKLWPCKLKPAVFSLSYQIFMLNYKN